MSLFSRTPKPAAPQPDRTIEAIPTLDPDYRLDGNQYRMAGRVNRDLIGYALERAQNLSVHMYRANPLANRIIKINTTYMAGTGYANTARNPDVQQIVDEAWTAPRNQLESNHRPFARDYLLFGESCLPVATDVAGTGATTIGFIDPTAIDQIVADTRNNMILRTVLLRSQGGVEPPPLEIVTTQADPMQTNAGLLTGDAFMWLFDRIGGSTRGTPFLLPIIDWLDAYDQTIWELLERVKATRAFFWDVKVEGGQTEVDDAKKIWGTTPPRSGSVRFSTNAFNVSATQPNIGGYEDVAVARFILRQIATGAGVAPHWLGDPEDANRSTADSMDAPIYRSLADVQAGWKTHLEDLNRFIVDQKVAAGIIPRIMPVHDEQGRPTGEMLPARDLVRVQLPNITDDDVVAAAGALTSVAQAFVAMDMVGLGDPETARMVIRTLLPSLGIAPEDLPDPDTAADETVAAALESISREAARGKLDRLLVEFAELD